VEYGPICHLTVRIILEHLAMMVNFVMELTHARPMANAFILEILATALLSVIMRHNSAWEHLEGQELVLRTNQVSL
jgi:hypothetical protein